MISIQTFSDARFQQAYTSAPLLDLAGRSVRMLVRRHAEDAAVYLDLSTDNGGIVPTADTTDTFGGYTVKIEQDQLLLLPVGDYVFSVIAYGSMAGGRGERIEIGRGVLTHTAGPTRFV